MSRVAKTLQNAKVSVFFHLVFIFVQFFARKLFLDHLGDEFIGLTSTLRSFLGFLNLAELGIGTAIGFSLYKPIFEKNYDEINKLINYFGFLYQRIGLIILGLSLILSGFFPWIFSDVQISLGIVYYGFFAFLANSMLGYFYNYHMFLLQADQKDYIVAKYTQSSTITKILLQCVLVFYFESFFWWITLELASTLYYSIALRRKIAREYPWLEIPLNSTGLTFRKYPELFRKIKQISVHKFGAFVSAGTDNIVIFAFVSVESVAFYGNYYLIINNFYSLLNRLFAGTNASVGNLVAEQNKEQINRVFWELMALRFFIASISTIGIFLLIEPFIELWLGSRYILEKSTLIFFSVNFFLQQVRQAVDVFIQAYGLYDDTWAPVTQSVINLAVSLVLVHYYGITGVLVGTFVSMIVIVMIWRPYYIYSRGFKRPIREYITGFLSLMVAVVLTYGIMQAIVRAIYDKPLDSYLDWGLFALQIVGLTALISALFLFVLSRGFRDLQARIWLLIRKRLKK